MGTLVMTYRPHPGIDRPDIDDPRCAACGDSISPNDVAVIEQGILWVDNLPYHPRHADDTRVRGLRDAKAKARGDGDYDSSPTDPHHGGKIWNP